MLRHRVIPVLLIKDRKLVKTIRFEDPKYVGDPINALRIFNDKGVDEVAVLDISLERAKRGPDMEFIKDLASECFMPLLYGGGVTTIEQIAEIFRIGVEKVSINSSIIQDPELLMSAADRFGSQSIVAAVDFRRDPTSGKALPCFVSGTVPLDVDLGDFVSQLEALGAGEIFIQSIERDGTRDGYDVEVVQEVSSAVSVPVIACGGASTIDDLCAVIRDGGASAAAAGSMFVFCGGRNSVLITYPTSDELQRVNQIS